MSKINKLNHPDWTWVTISDCNTKKYLYSDFLTKAKIKELRNRGYIVEVA